MKGFLLLKQISLISYLILKLSVASTTTFSLVTKESNLFLSNFSSTALTSKSGLI